MGEELHPVDGIIVEDLARLPGLKIRNMHSRKAMFIESVPAIPRRIPWRKLSLSHAGAWGLSQAD